MKVDAPLKLVSQLLDLPIVDSEGRWCGIVDDVELEGSAGKAGKEMRIKALLVGPGSYSGRMPCWAYWVVRKIAGERMARVPVDEIDEVGAAVKLRCMASEVGLGIVENQVRRWIPRRGAM